MAAPLKILAFLLAINRHCSEDMTKGTSLGFGHTLYVVKIWHQPIHSNSLNVVFFLLPDLQKIPGF